MSAELFRFVAPTVPAADRLPCEQFSDPECDLNYAVGAPVEKDVNYVLTNSLGFGGHNATLLLKKYEG